MCPLRVILLFLSAMLAGYLAIKTVRAQGESSIRDFTEEEPENQPHYQTGFLTKVSTGLSSIVRVTIDMLSGLYLYNNLKGQTRGVAVADD